jgi:hypothetical protein
MRIDPLDRIKVAQQPLSTIDEFWYVRSMAKNPRVSIIETTSISPLTWAALFGLVTACAACGTSGNCTTDELPPTDPCFQKGCCDSVTIGPDGGVTDDAGPDTTTRICGACNG